MPSLLPLMAIGGSKTAVFNGPDIGRTPTAALVVERFGRCVWLTRVREDNLNARIQECRLPQTMFQSRILNSVCVNVSTDGVKLTRFRAGVAATVARHRKWTFTRRRHGNA